MVSENKNSNQRKGKSNMDYIIETENLTKRYGTATVVDKVNLHVPTGKIYGFARQKRSRQNHSNENDVAACSPNGWNGTLVLAQTIRKISIPFIAK